MAYLVHDTFTVATNTDIDAHAPDSDHAGNGWSYILGSGSQLQVLAAQDRLYCVPMVQKSAAVETGEADAIIEGTVHINGNTDAFPHALVFRNTGADDTGWYVDLRPVANQVRLYEWQAAPVLRGTHGMTIDVSTDYAIKVRCRGQNIVVWVDGVEVIKYGGSAWCEAGDYHGFLLYNGDFADDFRVTGFSTMAHTLEELRADLARDAQLFFTGAASTGGTVGPPSTIIDTLGLGAIFTETGALISGLAYIREAGGTAPEEESAWVVGYNSTAEQVSVEPALSVAVGAGDTYELYLVPLSLADWNKCINEAIKQAWPKVWERNRYEVVSTGADEYALPNACQEALGVNVVMGGDYAGAPLTPYPRTHWTTRGTPGAALWLELRKPIGAADRTIQVVYKAKYAELDAGDSTELDYAYIMDAALSCIYAMLAGGAGPEAYSDRYLALVPFHRGLANEKLNELATALAGLPVVGQVK